MKMLACGAAAATAVLAGSAFGYSSSVTEGQFETRPDLAWAPACDLARPFTPFDHSERSRADYVFQAQMYADCINRQAQNDAAVAVAAVNAGRQAAIDKAKDQMLQDLN